MKCWSEIRTAYAVARLGTVSAAAEDLKLHRATVIRHIEVLENELGIRVFHRHARGYTPTETGLDLLRVARTTEEQLIQFAGRAKGREAKITGEIIITSLEIISPLVVRALVRFRERYPETNVRYIAGGRLLNLSYGEAHIAVRAGEKPTHPDNVIRPFFDLYSTFYAHKSYVKKHGLPTPENLSNHQFISHEDPSRMPFFTWLENEVPTNSIILRSKSQQVLMESLLAGMGIGFMPMYLAENNSELVQILSPKPKWFVPFWLVTHVDVHRTAKVQAISTFLQETANELAIFNAAQK